MYHCDDEQRLQLAFDFDIVIVAVFVVNVPAIPKNTAHRIIKSNWHETIGKSYCVKKAQKYDELL